MLKEKHSNEKVPEKKSGNLAGVKDFNKAVMSFVTQESEQIKVISNVNSKAISEMYGNINLAGCELFAGSFINFGFWPNKLPKGSLTLSQRIESQKNLYRHALNSLPISSTDMLLEVACGQGAGSRLALTEYQPKAVVSIDFSKNQIERAKDLNEEYINHRKMSFLVAAAEKLPFNANSFNQVISIEAVQHFENLKDFVLEAFRVLKPNGHLCIASFFASNENSISALKSMIETIPGGLDAAIPIEYFRDLLLGAGFKAVRVDPIGQNVWHGWDKWISQTEFKNTWNRNWYKSYKKKLLDYFLIVAKK